MQKRVVEPQADETRTESKVAVAEPSRGAPDAALEDCLRGIARFIESWGIVPVRKHHKLAAAIFLHDSCKPLVQIEFNPNPSPREMQMAFRMNRECLGVCGV